MKYVKLVTEEMVPIREYEIEKIFDKILKQKPNLNFVRVHWDMDYSFLTRESEESFNLEDEEAREIPTFIGSAGCPRHLMRSAKNVYDFRTLQVLYEHRRMRKIWKLDTKKLFKLANREWRKLGRYNK